ncbi:Membrane protein involved in the export of O-antigen and teichoic acid [Bacillus sp. OV322]|uniref:lipopolysaccharide biosynthesis protein n=1 Tax=Bacillus sp. OV322 TaxID=1882764 RepID=UPI0008E23E25|nr:oligosaccharide flippase family protein [Bacillus sp. OV322]SFC52481.1 Membrane protein involved in the export of O-antigen and teichoic acid [Bacillus sp. OV322]
MKSKLLKNDTLSNITSLGAATLTNALLSFLIGVLTRNILGPEQYGYWVSVTLIFTFTPLFHLGTLNAMNRQVPFFLARNDLKKVQEIRESVFSFLFTVPIYIIVLLLFTSIFMSFSDIPNEYKSGLFLVTVIVFFSYLSNYVEMYFKSQQDFKKTSKLVSIRSITQSVLTLSFVVWFGYLGMYLGMLLALIIQVFIARKVIPFKRKKGNSSNFKELIKVGFPILLVGIVWGITIASDRFIITIFMTPQDLGNYSVGMFVFSTVMLFPQVLDQIFYPEIVSLVSKNKVIEVKKLYFKVNKILALIMLGIVICGYFLLPYFIKWYMPEYNEGIKTAQILLFGVYPLTLVGIAANYFNSTDNQKVYVSIQLFCILLNVILSIVFLHYVYSISSVALATSISFFIYCILMNIVFLIKIRKQINSEKIS